MEHLKLHNMEKTDFLEWFSNNAFCTVLVLFSLDSTLQFFEVCLVISLVAYNVVRTKQVMNEEKRKNAEQIDESKKDDSSNT